MEKSNFSVRLTEKNNIYVDIEKHSIETKSHKKQIRKKKEKQKSYCTTWQHRQFMYKDLFVGEHIDSFAQKLMQRKTSWDNGR